MTRSGDHPAEAPLDPDPFTLTALIVGTIGSASGVYSVIHSRSLRREQSQERSGRRLAEVHRWQDNLHELRDILEDLSTFAERAGLVKAQQHHPGRLEPMESGVFLSQGDLRRYRQLLDRLISQTRRLNDSSFQLIELIDDQRTVAYLADTASRMREVLRKLREMNSVRQSLADALQGVGMLLQTAAYLREEVIL